MKYKITERVVHLVQDLYAAGYEGEAALTNNYCTGTAEFFGEMFSIQLTGFCKETLHIAEDTETGSITCVGRYSLELEKSEIAVPDIVQVAWDIYKSYKDSGYSMPYEFKEMFVRAGYIKEKKVTKTVWEEQ